MQNKMRVITAYYLCENTFVFESVSVNGYLRRGYRVRVALRVGADVPRAFRKWIGSNELLHVERLAPLENIGQRHSRLHGLKVLTLQVFRSIRAEVGSSCRPRADWTGWPSREIRVYGVLNVQASVRADGPKRLNMFDAIKIDQ